MVFSLLVITKITTGNCTYSTFSWLLRWLPWTLLSSAVATLFPKNYVPTELNCVKLFEMERNHGRLFKTGLERPPRTTHAGYCVSQYVLYGTSLLGIVVLKDVFVFSQN